MKSNARWVKGNTVIRSKSWLEVSVFDSKSYRPSF